MILLKRQLHNITKQAHYLFPALFTWFYLLAGPEEKTPIYHAMGVMSSRLRSWRGLEGGGGGGGGELQILVSKSAQDRKPIY